MKVDFNGETYDVEFSFYVSSDNVAIILRDQQDGTGAYVATVNGEIDTDGTYVGIKDWSENEGIVYALFDAGILLDEVVTVEPTGFVLIPYLRLTDEALAEIAESRVRVYGE